LPGAFALSSLSMRLPSDGGSDGSCGADAREELDARMLLLAQRRVRAACSRWVAHPALCSQPHCFT